MAAGIRTLIGRVETAKIEDRRTAHEKWWQDFWNRSWVRVSGGRAQQTVSCGYMLQRFINACGGRGAQPIKFNGSIFTVDAKERRIARRRLQARGWTVPISEYSPDLLADAGLW